MVYITTIMNCIISLVSFDIKQHKGIDRRWLISSLWLCLSCVTLCLTLRLDMMSLPVERVFQVSCHSLGRTFGKSSPFPPYQHVRLATHVRTLYFRRFSPLRDIIWRQPDQVNKICIVYGIAGMFYGYSQWSTRSTRSDITLNLKIRQSVDVCTFISLTSLILGLYAEVAVLFLQKQVYVTFG